MTQRRVINNRAESFTLRKKNACSASNSCEKRSCYVEGRCVVRSSTRVKRKELRVKFVRWKSVVVSKFLQNLIEVSSFVNFLTLE